jgi:hypothetical protein
MAGADPAVSVRSRGGDRCGVALLPLMNSSLAHETQLMSRAGLVGALFEPTEVVGGR